MAIVAEQMGVSTAPPQQQQTMGSVPSQGMPADEPETEEEMLEDEQEADVDDPNYQAALQFVADALYRNDAAQSIAVRLRKTPDKVRALADAAYEIMSVAVEKLEGRLPEELYVLFAATVLEELGDIAEAAGIDYSPADLAEVFKQIVLRFLGELGVNTSELETAMGQITPETFNKLSEQAGDIPDDR